VSISLQPVLGVGQIRAGDDLASILAAALRKSGPDLCDGDVLVVCQKVVSKAELTAEPGGVPELAERYDGPALVELYCGGAVCEQ
jgi:coenzyme F420-0:L-glutamate ligase/coenzyme F420-1:gamma-L-glutamate ligase